MPQKSRLIQNGDFKQSATWCCYVNIIISLRKYVRKFGVIKHVALIILNLKKYLFILHHHFISKSNQNHKKIYHGRNPTSITYEKSLFRKVTHLIKHLIIYKSSGRYRTTTHTFHTWREKSLQLSISLSVVIILLVIVWKLHKINCNCLTMDRLWTSWYCFQLLIQVTDWNHKINCYLDIPILSSKNYLTSISFYEE